MRNWLENVASLNKNEDPKEFSAQMIPKITLQMNRSCTSFYQCITEIKKIYSRHVTKVNLTSPNFRELGLWLISLAQLLEQIHPFRNFSERFSIPRYSHFAKIGSVQKQKHGNVVNKNWVRTYCVLGSLVGFASDSLPTHMLHFLWLNF